MGSELALILLATQAASQSITVSHRLLYSIAGDSQFRLSTLEAGGDLDQDGRSDFVFKDMSVSSARGKVRAVSGVSGTTLWEVTGSQQAIQNVQQGEYLGTSVAFVDWDGDGAVDVATGAPLYCVTPCLPQGTLRSGRVALFRGSDGAPLANVLAPDLGGLFNGALAGFGVRLASGADLTGDAIPDLVTAALDWSPTSAILYAGGVFVVDVAGGQVSAGSPGTMPGETPGADGLFIPYGDVFVLPGSGPLGAPLIGVGSPRTYSPTAAAIGSLRVYGAAAGILPLLGEQLGSIAYERLGADVGGGRDCTGDGVFDFAVLSRPYTPTGIPPLPPPKVTLYSGADLQPVWEVAPSSGFPIARQVDLVGDQNGDGLADVLFTRSGNLAPGVPLSVPFRVEIYSGPDGALVYDWVPSNPQGTIIRGFDLHDVNGDGLGDVGILPQSGTPPFYGNLDVYAQRNLLSNGPVSPGGAAGFLINTPRFPFAPALLLFALSESPSIPIGPLTVPLAPDALFFASLAAGIGGTLDAAGSGSVSIAVPPDPGLSGLSVVASGVIADPAQPFGIGAVLTALSIVIL
jgi:hypothetical protein